MFSSWGRGYNIIINIASNEDVPFMLIGFVLSHMHNTKANFYQIARVWWTCPNESWAQLPIIKRSCHVFVNMNIIFGWEGLVVAISRPLKSMHVGGSSKIVRHDKKVKLGFLFLFFFFFLSLLDVTFQFLYLYNFYVCYTFL